MIPDDLKNYRPSESDLFVKITGDAAVFFFVTLILLAWAFGK